MVVCLSFARQGNYRYVITPRVNIPRLQVEVVDRNLVTEDGESRAGIRCKEGARSTRRARCVWERNSDPLISPAVRQPDRIIWRETERSPHRSLGRTISLICDRCGTTGKAEGRWSRSAIDMISGRASSACLFIVGPPRKLRSYNYKLVHTWFAKQVVTHWRRNCEWGFNQTDFWRLMQVDWFRDVLWVAADAVKTGRLLINIKSMY